MNQSNDLFISYAREDAVFALRLAKDLRAAGVSIWIDQLDIDPGERWDDAIEQALNTCSRMLIVLSPASADNKNVKDEIAFALHEDKPIVPVLLQACKIPYRLLRMQHIDFTKDYQRGLQRLLHTLRVEEKPVMPVQEEPPPAPIPRPEPQPVRPTEKKPEPRIAPSVPTAFPQPNKTPFAWQRYAGAFAVVAVLALTIWKGIDWGGSSSHDPPVTKKAEDSSEKRETSRIRTTPPGVVFIEGGAFLMGSDDGEADEKPMRTVIVNDFYLDEHEVTVAAYQDFISATGHAPPLQWAEQLRSRDHPVVYVSWNDAKAYAKWAGKRLPYEAEWEYAARGGNTGLNGKSRYKYPWGDEASHERANYDGTEGRDRWDGTSPIKSFPATGFGLYDMAGNVWEWCEDWYDENYYKNRPSPDRNPKGPSTGQYRVLRGGSWLYDPNNLRCAYRSRFAATDQDYNIGFRCAQDVQ